MPYSISFSFYPNQYFHIYNSIFIILLLNILYRYYHIHFSALGHPKIILFYIHICMDITYIYHLLIYSFFILNLILIFIFLLFLLVLMLCNIRDMILYYNLINIFLYIFQNISDMFNNQHIQLDFLLCFHILNI